MVLLAAMMLFAATPAEDANRGRTALQAGQLAEAILIYREGLQRHPADELLQADLREARRMVAYPRDEMTPLEFDGWRHRISEQELFILFGLALSITSLAAFKYATSRPRWALPFGIAGLACGLAVVGFFNTIRRANPEALGVVARATMLREGNGESYPAKFDALLPVGAEVVILHERGGWLQVRLPRGTTGWLPATNVLRNAQ